MSATALATVVLACPTPSLVVAYSPGSHGVVFSPPFTQLAGVTPTAHTFEATICARLFKAPPLRWDGGRRIRRSGLTSLTCRTARGAILVLLTRRHELVGLLPGRGVFLDMTLTRRGSAIAFDPGVCRRA